MECEKIYPLSIIFSKASFLISAIHLVPEESKEKVLEITFSLNFTCLCIHLNFYFISNLLKNVVTQGKNTNFPQNYSIPIGREMGRKTLIRRLQRHM